MYECKNWDKYNNFICGKHPIWVWFLFLINSKGIWTRSYECVEVISVKYKRGRDGMRIDFLILIEEW